VCYLSEREDVIVVLRGAAAEMEVIPTHGRILVRARAKGGAASERIILPSTIAIRAAPQQGTVLAIGEGVVGLAVDDVVVFGHGAGDRFWSDDDEELLMMPAVAVVARIELEVLSPGEPHCAVARGHE